MQGCSWPVISMRAGQHSCPAELNLGDPLDVAVLAIMCNDLRYPLCINLMMTLLATKNFYIKRKVCRSHVPISCVLHVTEI